MKIAISVLIIIFSTLVDLTAQNIRVKVVNDSEPLPYAYIFINNKITTTTDSIGVALIALKKLTIGDTISASYIGTAPSYVVFDGQSSYQITLSESFAYDIEQVDIVPDIEKMFRKKVARQYTVVGSPIMEADFSIRFTPGQSLSGKLRAEHTIKGDYKRYYTTPLEIKTKIDTSSLDMTYIRTILHHSISEANVPSSMLFHFRKGKSHYGYLGVRNGEHVFRVTYSEASFSDDFAYQILVRADAKTRSIKSTEIDAISTRGYWRMKISQNYRPFKHRNPLARSVIFQNQIDEKIEFNYGEKIDIQFTNIKISLRR